MMFSNVCSGGVGLRFIRGLFKFIVNAVLLLLVVYTVLNAIGGIETDVEPVVDVTQLRASLVRCLTTTLPDILMKTRGNRLFIGARSFKS